MNRSARRRSTRAIGRSPRRRAPGFLPLLIGVSTVLVLAGTYLSVLAGTAAQAPAIGGHWSLMRDDGMPVTDRDFRGRYALVYFGYTACPDVCPTTLVAVADAMQRLGARANRLQPLFVTVDPARDTPPVLHAYLKSFGARLVGLTGTEAQIATVEREYLIRARAVTDPTPHGGDAIDHSAVLLLLGPDGRYLAPLPPDETGEEIATRLEHYLS